MAVCRGVPCACWPTWLHQFHVGHSFDIRSVHQIRSATDSSRPLPDERDVYLKCFPGRWQCRGQPRLSQEAQHSGENMKQLCLLATRSSHVATATQRLFSTSACMLERKTLVPFDDRYELNPKDVGPHKKGGSMKIARYLGRRSK